MDEPSLGLLVELGDPDAASKPQTPPNIEEQMRKMDLSMQKRRDSAKAKRCKLESPLPFDDIVMLQDEEFDFDAPGLSTSSDSLADPDGDDEEVFFGKVGLTEKCVAKAVEREDHTDAPENVPLSAAEVAEIFVEAQKVVCFISAQDREKGASTPNVATRLFANTEGQSSVETRSQGRKRKGTFTLEDEEPAKRPGHSRKGTFTLESSDEDTPVRAPRSTSSKTLEISKDSSAPVDGSKLQRNAPQRRSLKMPSGRFGLAKGGDQPSKTIGPLKALPKPATETKERIKRLSGGIPQPATAASQVPQQAACGRAMPGLKAPSSSLQQPVAGRGGISGLKAPTGLLLQRPGSGSTTTGLKAPTRKSLPAPTATSNSNLPAAKPSLKAPTTKLQLMRPGQIQMRGPVAKQPAGQNGPLKATERLSGLKGPEPRLPLTSHVNGVTQPQPAVKRAASPIRRSIQTTPVKQEKNVQPKRLMAGLQKLGTPPRKNDSSNASQTPTSNKRRSFLPTPGRTFTGPRRSSSSVSSVGSTDSTASPQLRGRSPATRRSIASPMKARPKIQHTPQNKENTGQEPKRSIWSPIKRRKPLTKEEELTQCTKRTTYNLH